MKRRALLAAVAALVLGVAPPAGAHTYWSVDDTCNVRGDDYFYPGGPTQWWYIHRNAQTFGTCHLYTTNAQTSQYNYADWYLPTRTCQAPASVMLTGHSDGRCGNERLYTGTYQALAYLAREAHFTTRRAPYTRYATNLRGQRQTVRIDQAAASTGNNLILTGYFDTRVDQGYSGFMRVSDYTGEPSQSRFIGVDRMYYHPVH